MKRRTHLLLGAAAGAVVAIDAPVAIAAGAVWLGMVGGGYPDWLDLRSELRGSLRLRHRGASHGLPVAAAVTALVFLALTALSEGLIAGMPMRYQPDEVTVRLWTVALFAGFVTHLVSDAMNPAGVRPLLPFTDVRVWALPRPLRMRSSGRVNGPVQLLAMLILVGGVVLRLMPLMPAI